MKNIDKIRQMNSEELVNSGVIRIACNICVYQRIKGNEFIPCNDKNCKEGIKQWLEQEVEE